MSIDGTSGRDSLRGNPLIFPFFDEEFNGFGGDDDIVAFNGDDTLRGGSGADYLDGGDGFDFAAYDTSSAAVDVRLGEYGFTNTFTQRPVEGEGRGSGGHAEGDVLIRIEGVIGSRFDDTLSGGRSFDFEFIAGDGDDLLVSGPGRDTLRGGAGLDTVSYAGSGGLGIRGSDAGVVVVLETPGLLGTGSARGGFAVGDRLSSVENLIGSAFDDSLVGNLLANVLDGDDGDDALAGLGGADTLRGGDGDDTLSGGEGADSLSGGPGRDSLDGGDGADTLSGGDDVDTLSAGDGDDRLDGGSGADVVNGGGGDDRIVFDGSDIVNGGPGRDRIVTLRPISIDLELMTERLTSIEEIESAAEGGSIPANNEALRGNAAANGLFGGDGADVLEGRGGADTLDGGPGVDTASYESSPAGVTVRLDDPGISGSARGGDAEGDRLVGIERLLGSAFRDVLTGTSGNDTISGGGGADDLLGLSGQDVLDGGAGDDRLDGGPGNDTLVGGGGADTLDGGSDTRGVFAGVLVGGDEASYDGEPFAVSVTLRDGGLDGTARTTVPFVAATASAPDALGIGVVGRASFTAVTDVLRGIEHVRGTAFGDALTGNAEANNLAGGAGADTLAGGGGDDVLSGGSGDDTYVFGPSGQGADRWIESGGFDTALFDFRTLTAVTRDGDDLVATLTSGSFRVLGHFRNADAAVESAKDTATGRVVTLAVGLVGGDASGIIAGGEEGETLDGRGGDDLLYGNGGDDRLLGGQGNDLLDGGAGDDTLVGGEGADVFAASPGHDRVDDFRPGLDRIALPSGATTIAGLGREASIRSEGGDTVIAFSGGSLRLSGVARIGDDDLAPSARLAAANDRSLVDRTFYLGQYADVSAAEVAPDAHYDAFGWREGRDPNALFSTTAYLAANPDVAAAGLNPLAHYDQHGWREGRDPGPGFSTRAYLAYNPDVAAAGINPLSHQLSFGAGEGRAVFPGGSVGGLIGAFDSRYYLAANPDVAAAAADPFDHYLTYGWVEGRDPNALFSTLDYLGRNPDVAASGVNPLLHYEGYGWREGRDASDRFDAAGYLSSNPDVAAAHIDPLQHLLQYGLAEGRGGWQV